MKQETFKLLFSSGPREGDEIPLGDNITTLGRSKRNTIALEDPSISREHLRFYVEDDQVSVEDSGSSRGTLINGQALTTRVALKHGDKLDIGNQEIEVVSVNETLGGDDQATIFENLEEIEEKFNSEGQLDFERVKAQVEGNTPAPEAPPSVKDPGDTGPKLEENDACIAEHSRQDEPGGTCTTTRTAPQRKKPSPLLLGSILLVIAIAGIYLYRALQPHADRPTPPSPATVNGENAK
jgi:predicted component of type VI protein secretion system